jgi:flagellar biosynthetic protein FliR
MLPELSCSALAAAPAVRAAATAGCRVAGMLWMAAPPLGGSVPFPVRAALFLSLTAAVVPFARAPEPGASLALVCLGEVLVGLLLALPLRLVFEALRHAGEIVSAAALPVPSSSQSILDGSRASAAGHVAVIAALAAVFASGGDRAAIRTLTGSFSLLPPGSAITAERLGAAASELGASYFQTVALAILPFVAALLVVEAALTLATRTASLEAASEVVPAARALLMLALLGVSLSLAFLPAAASAVSAPLPSFLFRGVTQ